jgi:hypothetical protein
MAMGNDSGTRRQDSRVDTSLPLQLGDDLPAAPAYRARALALDDLLRRKTVLAPHCRRERAPHTSTALTSFMFNGRPRILVRVPYDNMSVWLPSGTLPVGPGKTPQAFGCRTTAGRSPSSCSLFPRSSKCRDFPFDTTHATDATDAQRASSSDVGHDDEAAAIGPRERRVHSIRGRRQSLGC